MRNPGAASRYDVGLESYGREIEVAGYFYLTLYRITGAMWWSFIRIPSFFFYLLCSNCVCGCGAPILAIVLGLTLMQVPAYHEPIFASVETAAKEGTDTWNTLTDFVNT